MQSLSDLDDAAGKREEVFHPAQKLVLLRAKPDHIVKQVVEEGAHARRVEQQVLKQCRLAAAACVLDDVGQLIAELEQSEHFSAT